MRTPAKRLGVPSDAHRRIIQVLDRFRMAYLYFGVTLTGSEETNSYFRAFLSLRCFIENEWPPEYRTGEIFRKFDVVVLRIHGTPRKNVQVFPKVSENIFRFKINWESYYFAKLKGISHSL